jgi:hypothetical protein
MKHKIPNLFLFPIIIGLARLYIDTPEKYASFKQLAFEKMFKWQWKVLDKILNM